MSIKLDQEIESIGARFRVFPQPSFLPAFREPETIVLSLPPEKIAPGPSDDRFYVIDAINKKPYNHPYVPPHNGQSNPPVVADENTGHYDYLEVNSREFQAAHMYACVRRVLDVWEDYFSSTIKWHFKLHYDRMELIPLISWDNAHSGYGFLEFGYGRTEWGGLDKSKPYCMNFDVLAHELGHSIVFSKVGFPNSSSRTDEYGGFHEAIGDIVALVSTLHFNKVIDHLLNSSKGNLFTVNEVSRIGELSNSRQIRKAFNYEKMSTVSSEAHDLSKPLTGAIFDIMVEVFQNKMVDKGIISQELADLSYHGPEEDVNDTKVQQQFDHAYSGNESAFKLALLEARDYLGGLISKMLNNISPHFLSYTQVGNELLSADASVNDGRFSETIRDCFSWREIGITQDEFLMSEWKITDCNP